MRLHLHIGMPKCGSTTIQEYFGLNREKLAAVGWHYPESVFPLIEGPNTNLPSLLAEGVVELEHVCRPLLDGTATDLLLSSEFFFLFMSRFSTETLETFRQRLHDLNIELRIYCIYRDPASFMVSMYKQRIVNRVENDQLFDEIKAPNADWLVLTKPFIEILHPHAFHALQLKRTYLRDLVLLLGLNDLELELPSGNQNTSLPDVYVEILRQFNTMRETGAGRGSVAKLILDVNPASSRALERQAGKARKDKRGVLQSDLDRLAYLANPPLRYTEADFNKAVETLRSLIARPAAEVASGVGKGTRRAVRSSQTAPFNERQD